MYVEVVIAIEAHEIMPVTLMVAEEQVLAVHTAVVLPPLLGLLDGFALWVVIASERNPMHLKIGEHRLLPPAYYCFPLLAYWRCCLF